MSNICCILIWMIFLLILLSNLFPVSFGVTTNFIMEIPILLLFTLHIAKNIAYHTTEVLIFYTDKREKNLCVFNFMILVKSQKFDARKIYMFYSSCYYCLVIGGIMS